jgi:hypothetical protein
MAINNIENEFIKIENKPTIIDKFNEQDKSIYTRVKPENKTIVKDIILKYSLTHSLKSIFDSFENDYERLKIELEKFSQKRYNDLVNLTKNL